MGYLSTLSEKGGTTVKYSCLDCPARYLCFPSNTIMTDDVCETFIELAERKENEKTENDRTEHH